MDMWQGGCDPFWRKDSPAWWMAPVRWLRYSCGMSWNGNRRALLDKIETRVGAQMAEASERVEMVVGTPRSAWRIAMTAAWVTGALAVLAGGLYAGKEIRTRYKVTRRTPYDYYAHAGDRRTADLDFGVGI